jgi:hypothetical protein
MGAGRGLAECRCCRGMGMLFSPGGGIGDVTFADADAMGTEVEAAGVLWWEVVDA